MLADAAELLDEDRFLEAQRKVGEAMRIDPGPEAVGILYLISGLALAEEGQYRPAEQSLRIALRFGLSADNEARALTALDELGVVR
ncbi:MAG: hypothetical protein IH935_04885 [Acidobacteria bacterium]|nr:hypothetical protein [Acidobacteriota bacterium]